jgi:hypothetical protein
VRRRGSSSSSPWICNSNELGGDTLGCRSAATYHATGFLDASYECAPMRWGRGSATSADGDLPGGSLAEVGIFRPCDDGDTPTIFKASTLAAILPLV